MGRERSDAKGAFGQRPKGRPGRPLKRTPKESSEWVACAPPLSKTDGLAYSSPPLPPHRLLLELAERPVRVEGTLLRQLFSLLELTDDCLVTISRPHPTVLHPYPTLPPTSPCSSTRSSTLSNDCFSARLAQPLLLFDDARLLFAPRSGPPQRQPSTQIQPSWRFGTLCNALASPLASLVAFGSFAPTGSFLPCSPSLLAPELAAVKPPGRSSGSSCRCLPVDVSRSLGRSVPSQHGQLLHQALGVRFQLAPRLARPLASRKVVERLLPPRLAPRKGLCQPPHVHRERSWLSRSLAKLDSSRQAPHGTPA